MGKVHRPTDITKKTIFKADIATGEINDSANGLHGKNPIAVAPGKLGGLKGSKARAAQLIVKKRAEIAKKTASKRWGKQFSS